MAWIILIAFFAVCIAAAFVPDRRDMDDRDRRGWWPGAPRSR